MKEGINIIQITKQEVDYLLSKGLTFGTNTEGDIHRTFSRYKKYFLTESSYNLNLLKDFREKNIITKTY